MKKYLSIIIITFFGLSQMLLGMESEERAINPSGIISSFAGERAPVGWLLCDGTQYSSQEYSRLYEIIKTKYVPHNEKLTILEHNENNEYKLFRVPDLRGRVIIGVDGNAGRVTSNNKLGESGGEEKHKLTINEMPSHNHTLSYFLYGGLAPGKNEGCFTKLQIQVSNDNTFNTGGDQPHNIIQPYLTLNYIIKY